MEDELPNIQIGDITDHDDGTCTIEFFTNDAFDKMYLEQTGAETVTEEGLSDYILDILTKAVEGKDGYNIAE